VIKQSLSTHRTTGNWQLATANEGPKLINSQSNLAIS
jgi:hypothetical protein